MAKKSKTQRAKASARRQEKRTVAEQLDVVDSTDGAEAASGSSKSVKRTSSATKEASSTAKKELKPVKKEDGKITTFFKGVKSELKRVTWPSRQDVIRWSGVVVVALLFFGVYVFILDNWIVVPLLALIPYVGV